MQVTNMQLIRSEAAKALSEMEAAYPRGTNVEFFIMDGQKQPSSGVVSGYEFKVMAFPSYVYAEGLLTVEHAQAKKDSRYRFRRVPTNKIIRRHP